MTRLADAARKVVSKAGSGQRKGLLRRRFARKAKPQRLSDLLSDLAADESRERIALSDLLDSLKVRAFGPLLLIFALPNIVPTPPGTSAVLGLPLIFLTFQMLTGGAPWFPAFLAHRSLARTDFARMAAVIVPRLARTERMLRPRLGFLSSKFAEQALGVLCLVLSVILTLPVPLGNMAPAFALALIGLGLFERDGLWVLAGVAAGIGALVLVHGVIWALVMTGLHVVTTYF